MNCKKPFDWFIKWKSSKLVPFVFVDRFVGYRLECEDALKPFYALLFLSLTFSSVLRADNPAGPLRIEVTTAYNFIVDSNVESPSTYAPRSAYISARIWNDGVTDLTGVYAYVGNGTTPGVYDSTTVAEGEGRGYWGTFSLTHEGGSLGAGDAARFVGTIPAGEYVPVYWLVSYPNLDPNGQSVTGGSKPDDDLVLDYTVWATDGTNTADVPRTATMRNCISAMANKIFPNTANKVPQEYQDLLEKYEPQWNSLAADGSPGTSIVTEGIWYDLGNVAQGFDNDGDLVPDANAWLQPVGDPGLLDPSQFRLVNTYTLLVVKLKGGGEQVYDVRDQLYFSNLPDNNGVIGLVRYDYLPLAANASAQLTPYQMAASGFDNEKFNGDYGANIGGPSSVSSPLTLDKTVDVGTADPGDTLAYTLSFSNPGSQVVGNPDNGSPLVVRDRIPANTSYVSGSAASGNTLPAGVASYEVRYSTDSGATWTTTEPGDPTTVTDLQWRLSDAFAGGASGIVTFSVTVDSPGVGVVSVLNTGELAFGDTEAFLSDSASTAMNGIYSISGTVFEDDGAGATDTYGDGVQNSLSEAGLDLVNVSLYYDADGSGTVTSGDILLGTTATDVNGDYAFSNLPNGDFLVAVDTEDGDIPSGATATSPTTLAVTLSGGSSGGNDFGFAPTLIVSKTGPASAREGETVSYTLDVTNQYSGAGVQVVDELWAGTATTPTGNNTWNGTSVSEATGAPDSNGTVTSFSNNGNNITLSNFGTPGGSTVNSVELILVGQGSLFGGAGSNVPKLSVEINGVTTAESPLEVTDTGFNGTFYTYTTTLTKTGSAWTAADFAAMSVVITAVKQGNTATTMDLDAVGFRVGSTQSTTLGTVPVTDTYNADELTFVSATPSPDATSVSGSDGTLTWNNIGPIAPGGSSSITVNFTAAASTSLTTTNRLSVTGALFENGDPANEGEDAADTLLIPGADIGDTIYFDVNQNGVQDPNEPGIENAVVHLYQGGSLLDTATTGADGTYRFVNLDAGTYEVRTDTTTGALSGATLTGDPDSDGEPCTGPLAFGCDGVDEVTVTAGQTYAGADFGYFLPGGVISGTLWIDFDDDGIVDDSEVALPYITVTLYDDLGGVVATTETDSEGSYSFGGLGDDTYRVEVDSSDTDFPEGVAASYELDETPNDEQVPGIVVSGGEVTGIGGLGSYTGSGDDIDFGYAYTGDNTLSGTIGLDGASPDGVLGSGDSGVDGDEVAFENVTVYLYLWDDAGEIGTVESGETTLIGTTTTDAVGDYAFAGLPEGDGDDLYIVSMVPPIQKLSLTTTVSDTPATVLVDTVNTEGHTTGAYQALPVAQSATNLDFAFESVVDLDFGDLPSSYNVLLPSGARHAVASTPDLYLGAGVTTESNGTVSADSSADANDDGVTVEGIWSNGTGGGSVQVVVVGTGWLVGYIDFNNDGDFTDVGELVVSQSASSETVTATFTIPSGTLSETDTTFLYSRFRILPSEPFFPALSYTGEADNGEVEDYRWAFNAISGTVWEDTDTDSSFSGGDTGRAGVVVTLYRDGTPVATTVTDLNGGYGFSGLPDGSYTVEMAEPSGATAILDQDGGSYTVNGDQASLVLSGASVSGEDFLLDTGSTLASISGTVFFDSTDDDDFTGTDDGRQGVAVRLYRDTGNLGVADENELVGTVTTDASGAYRFGDLPSGDYLVRLVAGSRVTPIKDVDGSANGNDLNGGITLSGTDVTGQDFLTDAATTSGFCLALNGGSLDGEFIRTEGESGVTYAVEYASELADPTLWEGTVTLDGSNSSAVTNGDGTETVTVTDLPGLTGLGGGEGFVRILRTEGGSETSTGVSGWVDSDFGAYCRSFSDPFVSCSVLDSTVSGVSGQDLVLADTVPSLGGGAYYVEVTAGDFEGHRFDISSVSGNTVTLANDSDLCGISAPNSTRTGPPPADLEGDGLAIRPHRTLDDLFPPAVFQATGSQSTADRVILHNAGSWETYWLYDDGGDGRWVLTGDATLTDRGSVVLPPGHGAFVDSAGIKTLTTYGQVRDHDFARPLCADRNLVAGGYPLDQSALARGLSKDAGFDGNPDFKRADQFLVWNGDVEDGGTGYYVYYLLDSTSIVRWVVTGDVHVTRRDAETLFFRDRAVVVDSRNGLDTYVQPLTWTP